MSQELEEGYSFSPVWQKHPYEREETGWPISVLSQDLLSPRALGEAGLQAILAFVPFTLFQES